MLTVNLLKKRILPILSTLVVSTQAYGQTLVDMTLTESKGLIADMPAPIKSVVDQTPDIYSFPNSHGDDSVNYLGQTFRQLLIQDVKPIAYTLMRGDFVGNQDLAFAVLDSVFRYNRDLPKAAEFFVNGDEDHRVSAKDQNGSPLGIQEGSTFFDVYAGTTNLKVKLAGVDNTTKNSELFGWASDTISGWPIDANNDGVKSPQEFVDAMMNVVAQNAAKSAVSFSKPNGTLKPLDVEAAAITEDGLDIAQMLQKFLHGAVSLSQATGDYMSIDLGEGKGLLGDNENRYVKDGVERPFTVLEHHWDEAFGYFGAARDYGFYLEDEVTGGVSLDTFSEIRGMPRDSNGHRPLAFVGLEDSDGEISVRAEKNFGMSVNASKRDKGVPKLTSFKETIMESFLKGRQLISEKPQGYLQYVQAYSIVIGTEWEKVMGATALHYINKLEKDYSLYGTEAYSYTDLAKHYSELKGFALALQFNAHSPFTKETFAELHNLIRDQPVIPTGTATTLSSDVTAYVADLQEARALMSEIYGWTAEAGFVDSVLQGW